MLQNVFLSRAGGEGVVDGGRCVVVAPLTSGADLERATSSCAVPIPLASDLGVPRRIWSLRGDWVGGSGQEKSLVGGAGHDVGDVFRRRLPPWRRCQGITPFPSFPFARVKTLNPRIGRQRHSGVVYFLEVPSWGCGKVVVLRVGVLVFLWRCFLRCAVRVFDRSSSAGGSACQRVGTLGPG